MAISVISPPPTVLNCHFTKQDDGSYICDKNYLEINRSIYDGSVVTGEARINNESNPTRLFYAQQSEYYINFVCIESISYSRSTLASVRINRLLQSEAQSNIYYYSSMLIDSVNTFWVYDYDSSIGFYYIKYSNDTPDWDSFTSRISNGQIILEYYKSMTTYYYPTGKGNRTADELEFVSISDDVVTTDKFMVLPHSKQTVEGKILLRRETTTKVLSNDFKKQAEDNASQSPSADVPYLNEITQTYSLSDANHDKLQYLCNDNLLDNWYFGNPVNQRGQASYTGSGYGIDRWTAKEGIVSLSSGALSLENNTWIDQRIENLVDNRIYTLSLLTADGELITATSTVAKDGQGIYGPITGGGYISFNYSQELSRYYVELARYDATTPLNILAVKLELGSEQTLAHQDANGAWVLNEIPDYAEQLLKCQRYLRPASLNFIVSNSSGNFYASAIMQSPEPMRTVPVIVNGDYTAQVAREATGGQTATVSHVFTPTVYGAFAMQLTSGGSSIPNYVYIDGTGFNPLLSAEL